MTLDCFAETGIPLGRCETELSSVLVSKHDSHFQTCASKMKLYQCIVLVDSEDVDVRMSVIKLQEWTKETTSSCLSAAEIS